MQFTKVIYIMYHLLLILQTFYFMHIVYISVIFIITGNPSSALNNLNKLIAFSTNTFEISFKQAAISAKVTISLFMEPYLNIIKVSICNLEDLEVNFFNSVPTKQNNLFQTAPEQECWICNPQICQVLYGILYI